MSERSDGRPHILLVEDNATIRDAFCLLLTESGYEMSCASCGEEALKSLRETVPDLILMDLGLPDIPGLELTRRLKEDEATRDIPVVAITGRAQEADERACRAAGCAAHIAKPVNSRDLLEMIPAFIENG